jgi:DNA-binding CsgD family transcriptional regulator
VHSFHRALIKLYDLAEQVPHETFWEGALGVLHPWIGFHGAVLSIDGLQLALTLNLAASPAHLTCHECLHPAEQLLVSAIDAALKEMSFDLESPLQWDSGPGSKRTTVPGVESAAFPELWRHLVFFGARSAQHERGRWIALFRTTGAPFDAGEIGRFHASWFHLMRSSDMNLVRTLDRHDTDRTRRALAIVTTQGAILAADPHFCRQLRREWVDFQDKRLPQALVNTLFRGKTAYRGRHIDIVMARYTGYVVCAVNTADAPGRLSPTEYSVARRYAAGLSHKEIARELGLSPHTIRNQIARLYGKLDLHDKASLAQYLGANAEPRDSQSAGNTQSPGNIFLRNRASDQRS